jgi:hypothetical protein
MMCEFPPALAGFLGVTSDGGSNMKVVRLAAPFFAFVLTMAAVDVLAANQPNDPPAAPVPIQILTGKKVFISNGGSTAGWVALDLPYNEFYADMKSWGKYELVPAPAEADLVFEIAFVGALDRILLVIRDPKTHVAPWTSSEAAQPVARAATSRKKFDQAMTNLVDRLKKLATPTPPATPNPSN